MAPINEKMSESCLIWFGCVQKRATSASIRINGFIQVEWTKRHWGRHKLTLVEVLKKDSVDVVVKKDILIRR